ncbi:MAG: hypothetical protein WCY77_10200 [Weeksellaceae bacterium]
MKELFQNLQKQIAESVPAVNYVDENWGQLDLYGPEIPVKWPCVLLDLGQADFSNIGRVNNRIPANRQQGQASIEITLGMLKLTNTSFKSTATQKWHGFEVWEVVEELHQVIQGFQPTENSGGMIRTNVRKVRRDDGVQEIRITYSVGLNDC